MNKKTILSLCILPVILLICLSFSLDDGIKKIIDHYNAYEKQFPQRKVYLHLNQPAYTVGENIWFKAYLLNESNNVPNGDEKILYVELINPRNQVSQIKILKIKNGLCWGDFELTDTLFGGTYQIRACTTWMRNFDVGYMFRKQFEVYNPTKLYTRNEYKDAKKKTKKAKRKSNRFDIQFFPEGGYAIAGIQSTIAFKAINELGQPLETKGKIMDANNNILTNFQTVHDGMGTFSITMQNEVKYYAEFTLPNGEINKIALPKPQQSGWLLSFRPTKEKYIELIVKASKDIVENEYKKEFFIIAKSGDQIIDRQGKLEEDSMTISINKEELKQGVTVITLFDYKGEPLNERLVFIYPEVENTLEIISDKEQYLPEEDAVFNIEWNDLDGKPLRGNFSLSVVDTNIVYFPEYESNIVNYLLLSSDLKGAIDKPGYYFKDQTIETQKAMDLVMLTNGWRRFLWKEVLVDKLPAPKYELEKTMDLTGRITKYFFDIPSPESSVRLTILGGYNDSWTTTTDKKGKFIFPNLDYTDTLDILMEARTKNNKKNIMILVDELPPPELDFKPVIQYTKKELDQLWNTRRRWVYENPADKKEAEDPDLKLPERFKLHSEANNVVKMDDNSSYNSVLEALRGKVPGLQISGSGLESSANIRGLKSLSLSNQPLYLLDGSPVDLSTINSVNPRDVEYIEVLKDPANTAIYGLRGVNGVIAVYTRRGFLMKRGEIRFQMIGFHKAREFYVPKFEMKDVINNKTAKSACIYWNPNVEIESSGKTEIRIKTPKNQSSYKAVIEGVGTNGLFCRKMFEIVVKQD